MADPDEGTPAWFNKIGKEAAAEIVTLAEPIIKRYTEGGYAPGYVPLTLAALQAMEPETAVRLLTGMMQQDQSRAAGVRLFAQYLAWMEQTGQLSQAAGQQLTKAAGAGQAHALEG